MKERPILFSAPMVQAILQGRKTMTRRVVKPQGAILTDEMARLLNVRPPEKQNQSVIRCPYGQPGDRLWVRETFSTSAKGWIYRADNPDALKCAISLRWKPSIFMPRQASRIDLMIKSVRVERLNDITEYDAVREGVGVDESGFFKNYNTGLFEGYMGAEWSFETLWESINGKGSWDENPYVWVIEFERVKP